MDPSGICFSARCEMRIRLYISPDGFPVVTIYGVICLPPTDGKAMPLYINIMHVFGAISELFSSVILYPLRYILQYLEDSKTHKKVSSCPFDWILDFCDGFYLGLGSCLRWWLIGEKDVKTRKFFSTIRCNRTLSGVRGFKICCF